MLEDDASLSFSKPVDVLWSRDVLTDYFEMIKQPMDLGTILNNIDKNQYNNPENNLFDPNAFRFHARLVFLNALVYNQRGTDLHKLATRFLQFVDLQLQNLPVPLQPPSDQPQQRPPDSPSLQSEKKSEPNVDHVNSPTPTPQSPDQQDSELSQLQSQIDNLISQKKEAEAALAEIELMKNVPLTFEENSKLRDEVENLPWEKAEKVVAILRKYVDEALRHTNEDDPEFVTLEFSTVEPKLLRDIEALIRPDPRVEKERNTIQKLESQISAAKRKLKALPGGESGKKKRRHRR